VRLGGPVGMWAGSWRSGGAFIIFIGLSEGLPPCGTTAVRLNATERPAKEALLLGSLGRVGKALDSAIHLALGCVGPYSQPTWDLH
jgi:hypothetical protein